MAYLTVTTLVDVVDPTDGKLSLREAVAQANATSGSDTIRFLAALEGQTLVLTGGEMVINKDVTINGDRDGNGSRINIDADKKSRVFLVQGDDTNVNLSNMTISNGCGCGVGGYSGLSGGTILLNGGNLSLDNVAIMDSSTPGYGFGGTILANTGSNITMKNTQITGSYALQWGGVIFANKTNLTIISSNISNNRSWNGSGAAISMQGYSTLLIEQSNVSNNVTLYGSGGAISISNSHTVVKYSSINNNKSYSGGGGIYFSGGNLFIDNSTIANNSNDARSADFDTGGGGVRASLSGNLSIQNSTITGNKSVANGTRAIGGGISVTDKATLSIGNSIVAGNKSRSQKFISLGPDIYGVNITSNGHNIFGSGVTGNVAGDLENVSPAKVFATIDPITGGGQLTSKGIVPLRNSIANPALSGADPITAPNFGQLGTTPRPQPIGSLADIGAIEINQPLSTQSTINNDVLTGNGEYNSLRGFAGNDLLMGRGGIDSILGNDGSDVLDGGSGNDELDGDSGVDIASFAGNMPVVVDLSTNPGTAKRGGETDIVIDIEGVIGSSKADVFNGSAADNEFLGGLGKDTATGGGGRDLYAFRSAQESPAGAGHDVIKDFVPGQDVLDISNLDADATKPGQQIFRWVGKATLTGAAQLGYYVSGGNAIVRASTDADGTAELEIQLNGVKTLTPADFRW